MQWPHVKNFYVRTQYIDFSKTMVLFDIVNRFVVSESDVYDPAVAKQTNIKH